MYLLVASVGCSAVGGYLPVPQRGGGGGEEEEGEEEEDDVRNHEHKKFKRDCCS
jgi:hypothetical protein